MTTLEILGICAGITAAIQLSGFAVAYALCTETFYDILGGINFLALGAYAALASEQSMMSEKQIFNLVVFSSSRLWLLLFLAWRAHERGGDSRFDNVKDKFGLFLVFWIAQGMWVFLISLPTMLVLSSSSSEDELSLLDIISIVSFAMGVLLEVVADIQKALWVKQGRPGTFCQVGLWKYSRHPNYFAEMLQWWSSWALAYGSCNDSNNLIFWLCSSVSPLFTMHILVNLEATGLTNANGMNLKRYYDKCPEEYAKYRESTSILVPMVGYQYIPLSLKRTLLLDLERYEYPPALLEKKKQN